VDHRTRVDVDGNPRLGEAAGEKRKPEKPVSGRGGTVNAVQVFIVSCIRLIYCYCRLIKKTRV
jgi:hypothetical protein